MSKAVLCTIAVAPLLALAGCGGPETPAHLKIAGADADRGRVLMARYGCGACHRVPGVVGPEGLVGPPLDHYGERALLAGQLPNTPANLIAWIVDPPALIPETGMPNLGVTRADARDMAAYLYSLQSDEAIVWPPEVPPDRPRFDELNRPD